MRGDGEAVVAQRREGHGGAGRGGEAFEDRPDPVEPRDRGGSGVHGLGPEVVAAVLAAPGPLAVDDGAQVVVDGLEGDAGPARELLRREPLRVAAELLDDAQHPVGAAECGGTAGRGGEWRHGCSKEDRWSRRRWRVR
nr:hypothetical protein GCM10025732_45000 [Glycomyces mayteni]